LGARRQTQPDLCPQTRKPPKGFEEAETEGGGDGSLQGFGEVALRAAPPSMRDPESCGRRATIPEAEAGLAWRLQLTGKDPPPTSFAKALQSVAFPRISAHRLLILLANVDQ